MATVTLEPTTQFKFFVYDEGACFIRQFQDSEGNILELPFVPKLGLEPDAKADNVSLWLIGQGYQGSFDWVRCHQFIESM